MQLMKCGRFLGFLIVLIISWACHDEVSEPLPPVTLGKRDYTWEADTIAYAGSLQTLMQNMWASSATNIYLVGHNDRGFGEMYHSDGVHWQPIDLYFPDAHGNGAIDLWGIYGISANDIWAVGERIYYNPSPPPVLLDSSFTIHFDGIQWREYTVHGGRFLYSVWASSATDAWTAGANGTLFHFDGTYWTKVEIGNNYSYYSMAGVSSQQIYMMGYREDMVSPNDSGASFLFKYDGSAWKAIDTVMRTPGAAPPHFGYNLRCVGNQLYSVGANLYRYDGSQWTKIFEGPVNQMSKSSDNNIFAVGQSVYQYNGADWLEFTELRPVDGNYWLDCYTDGKEVFVLGDDFAHTPQRTIVLHGR